MQEIANILKVNKSTVFRQLKKDNIEPAMKEGNTNYYDAIVLQQLKQHFQATNKEPSKRDLLVETLQQQVAQLQQELEKERVRSDKQLHEKDKQIESLHKLMDQNQQLLLNEQNQQQLEETNNHNNDSAVAMVHEDKEKDRNVNLEPKNKDKRSLFDRIFHIN